MVSELRIVWCQFAHLYGLVDLIFHYASWHSRTVPQYLASYQIKLGLHETNLKIISYWTNRLQFWQFKYNQKFWLTFKNADNRVEQEHKFWIKLIAERGFINSYFYLYWLTVIEIIFLPGRTRGVRTWRWVKILAQCYDRNQPGWQSIVKNYLRPLFIVRAAAMKIHSRNISLGSQMFLRF